MAPHEPPRLRKSSTTLDYLRRQEHRRVKQITGQIGRTDLFRDLARRDYLALAPSVRNLDLAKGTEIYLSGDPADAIYIVASGDVELYATSAQDKPIERIQGTMSSDGYPASPAPRPAKLRLLPPMPLCGSSPRPRSTP